jgi:hypothetical protein
MFGTRHTASEVQFSQKPQKTGPVWAWVAIYPSGQQEEIWGFHSPQEAREWRTGNGLRARGIAPEAIWFFIQPMLAALVQSTSHHPRPPQHFRTCLPT